MPGTMAKVATGAKYQGYAALSRYVDSADGIMIFRRFGELHVRNLLYLQDEITLLEEKLHERDLLQGVEHGCRRRDTDLMRKGLMKQLRIKLKEYDEAVLATAAMRKFGSPKERPMRTLRAFIETTRPLVEDEEPALKDDWDLLSLKTWEDAFPTWVTETLRIGDWTRLTHSPEQQAKFESLNIDTEGLQMLFISSPRIRRLMRAFVTFSGCLFLLVPIILLFFLRSDAAKLGTIVCSLLLFSTVSAALTSAKNWEVVAACIAYAAVLVVFVAATLANLASNGMLKVKKTRVAFAWAVARIVSRHGHSSLGRPIYKLCTHSLPLAEHLTLMDTKVLRNMGEGLRGALVAPVIASVHGLAPAYSI